VTPLRQVVYLITSPLSKRDYDRFGIQRWLDRGWEVKVFDFTKCLKPEFWSYVNGDKLSFDFDGLKIIEDENSALTSVAALEDGTIFIDRISSSSRVEHKIRLAAKKKGMIINLNLGSIPTEYQSTHSKFLSNIRKIQDNPVRTFKTIINKIRHFYEPAPDYWIMGGTKSLHNILKGRPSIIKAHNYDYDFFLTDRSSEVELIGGRLVFLDGDEAYHSDYVHLGIKPYVTGENYYPTMNTGLSQIADALSCDVRIAAHPRSNYQSKPFKYSLPILKNQTFELIKQASVVVSHGSTALQWAVIMRKPIILVTTDEMNNSIFKRTTEAFASELGKDVVNLNRIPRKYDWKIQLFVNETKYKNYIETYTKQSGTPEKPVWDIVIDRMETDLFQVKDLQE